ncbi:MAG: GAF domain-containing protein [Chloroflexi bacterium]|nr:GAF domain-containing protein [Chloroflexota bacterium]
MPQLSKSSLESLLILADIARALDDFRPLQETLERICEQVASLRGYAATALLMLNDEHNALAIRGSAGMSSAYVEHINRSQRVLLDEGTAELAPSAHAFLHGTEVAISDIEAEPGYGAWKTSAQLLGYRAVVSVPVVVRSRMIGVLNCYGSAPHHHSDEELEVLRLVARLAGVAIETARMASEQRRATDELRAQTEQLHRKNQQLGALFAAVSHLTGVLAHADVTVVTRVAQALADISGGSVLVCGEDGRAVAFAGVADAEVRMHRIATGSRVVRRLRTEASFSSDGHSLVRVGAGAAPLGTLVLWPCLPEGNHVAEVAAAHAAAIVAAELQAGRADRALTTYARPAVLLALAHGLYPPDQVREAAGVLGVPVEQPFRLAAVSCGSTDEAAHLALVPGDLRAAGWPVVTGVHVGTAVLVLLEAEHATSETLRRAARELFRRRQRGIQRMGVSAMFESLTQLPVARDEALAALASPQTAGALVLYEDLGVFGSVARGLSANQAREVVDAVLRPLRTYDAARGTDLVRTLEAYVRAGGQPRAAAEALDVHVNTLHQRLRRCGELSAFDPHNLYDMSRIVLALELERILHGRSPDPAESRGSPAALRASVRAPRGTTDGLPPPT